MLNTDKVKEKQRLTPCEAMSSYLELLLIHSEHNDESYVEVYTFNQHPTISCQEAEDERGLSCDKESSKLNRK